MCRYAQYSYKPHLACFACRKTFKRRWLSDIDRDTTRADSVPATCPQCRGQLADMGLDFKSPPVRDVAAWQHLRNLYAAGITYHSCGCSGPGYVPATTAALASYLAERLAGYVQELRYWLTRPVLVTKAELELDKQQNWYRASRLPQAARLAKGRVDATQAVAYWQGRVSEVENHLARLKHPTLPHLAT